MISKIYNSNQILFKSGGRKGKSKAQLALMVERSKGKQYQRQEFIRYLEDKVAKEKKRR